MLAKRQNSFIFNVKIYLINLPKKCIQLFDPTLKTSKDPIVIIIKK